jgi:hypothetical protein
LRRDLRAPGHLCRNRRRYPFRSSRGCPRGEPDNNLIGTWIIPSGTIKAAKPKNGYPDCAILEGEAGQLELTLKLPDNSSLEFKAIDGTFPDWRRVVPAETKQEGLLIPIFDPDCLRRLWKAGEILGNQVSGLAHNGENGPSLVIYATADTFGLVMWMHNPVAWAAWPAWVSAASTLGDVGREAEVLAAE